MLVVIWVKYPAFGRYIVTIYTISIYTKESLITPVVVILWIISLHTSNANNFQLVFILLLETWRFSFSKKILVSKSKVFFLTEMGKTTK